MSHYCRLPSEKLLSRTMAKKWSVVREVHKPVLLSFLSEQHLSNDRLASLQWNNPLYASTLKSRDTQRLTV